MSDIIIREISAYNDVLECESLQEAAWNMSSPRDVIPAHIIHPIIKHGGLLLGAYDDNALVGFVFGFVGWQAKNIWREVEHYHCSEMMGIHPKYWNQSIGYRLKLAQREWLLDHGYTLAIWTFDPLLSRNAWLNFHKLGVICRTYIRDAYGQMSGLYAGLPTDRFEVEWWLNSKQVQQQIEASKTMTVSDWLEQGAQIIGEDYVPGISSGNSKLQETVVIRIPADFQALKQRSMDEAKLWRQQTREIFDTLFTMNYVAHSYTTDLESNSGYYILSKNLDLNQITG